MVFSIIFFSTQGNSKEYSPKIYSQSSKLQQNYSSANDPIVYYAAHTRGNMQLAVANNGSWGTFGQNISDPITGQQIQSCVYPKNSEIVFLWVGAMWIGAVVGRDTLVSCATEDYYQVQEFWPDPNDSFYVESIDESSPFYSENALSEEDIISVYTDTFTNVNLTGTDPTNQRHKPLGIKIEQRSMAWSYDYADDFILFDFKIQNIGNKQLEKVYMAIFVDGDVWHKTNRDGAHWTDDIIGFLPDFPAPEGYGFRDTVNIAYTADNDGDPTNGAWDNKSCLSVVGTRVIRTPSDSLKYSFNWWATDYVTDFGPRKSGTTNNPYRYFTNTEALPESDREKYYVMSQQEFDYDLLFTAVDHTDDGYKAPPANAENFADGYDTRYLLSFGPFTINPGEKLPITFAWVGGTDLHQDPTAFERLQSPTNPSVFYNQLNFDSLANNSRWASWIYDNPGVDTDGDGYLGKYRIVVFDSTYVIDTTYIIDTATIATDTIVIIDSGYVYNSADTFYYEGDGVPDFKGASPPPAPKFWITPNIGAINVRINGMNSELATDQFSGEKDFEGYRVYFGRDNLKQSYSLYTSYDMLNFNKYYFKSNLRPEPGFVLTEAPYSYDELVTIYSDTLMGFNFNPYLYDSPRNTFLYEDSLFYFAPQDYNASQFGINTELRRTYPDQPYPSTFNKDSVDASELTDDGYFKYFEYEVVIDNVLPSVEWFVNVTAFDYGSPEVGLTSLESSLDNNALSTVPVYDFDDIVSGKYNIYCYPNPYRGDQNYGANLENRNSLGYEGRRSTDAEDRNRRIHFANLPPKCKISIFSLDGDLINIINHDKDIYDPKAGVEEWDLITRNTQLVVSGLYYYVVEWDSGSFIGKFVIIL